MRRLLAVGCEMAATLGAVMLLFAVHLLWWTNHTARAEARDEVHRLERQWKRPGTEASGPPTSGTTSPGSPADPAAQDKERRAGGSRGAPTTGARPLAPSQSFAVLRIPRIGLTVPVAEGVDKHRVLDRGFVGHYTGAALPGETGNVALAGHRNTHGEPFRRLDRVRPGDTVTLSTADGDFRYRIDSVLPRTSPADSAVIQPVPTSATARPPGSAGYRKPGHYLTLTTCTPEFTSRYRMVVWGHLLEA
ncbi:class E sortase [Streptomyces sp. SID9124]|uniref:class E sortase n=1 Tax=Streptomyces sp. SID9124 TaxID=2706108 RepID=UPI0013DF28CA|nr:class E sortase [Streptomyces sp. SID9124]NED13006.1 class E sortase [Streptomyces sp. SID9124]